MKAMPLVRFIGPIFLLAFFLSSCADDGSGVSNSVTVEELSSSIKNESSSSSTKTDESSSSKIPDESSSSDKPVESSSSMAKSSSSEISSSSIKIEESSSSVESSSSEKPTESSSSEESSSSAARSSSSAKSSSSKTQSSSSLEQSSSSAKSSSSVSSSSALKSIYDAENNTLTDLRDGRVYKTTTIGTQIWMAENLNYLPKDTAGTYFAGRSVCGGGEYQSLQEGDCSIYGRLYEKNINAYSGFNKNICPDGWNVPTLKQWNVLVDFMGGSNVAGKEMKSNMLWLEQNLSNSFKFSALPAGYFNRKKGFMYDDGVKAVFTVHNLNTSQGNGIKIFETKESIQYTWFGDWYYLAIRCIKD